MHLLIASAKLANAARVAALAALADQRNRSPILGCCRLTAGGNLNIYGTDLDTGITALADCDVIEPGEAVVDVQRLADIARRLEGDARIEEKSGSLTIRCGRSRFTLATVSVEKYPPPLAVGDNRPAISLAAADVMAIFAGAAAGAACDDKRIYLSGATLFSEPTDFEHRLYAVGADGVVLSYAATPAACPNLGAGVIVHRDTCNFAVRLFDQTGASLRLSDNLIELTSGSCRLAAKLIGAAPTAWRSIVPPADASNSALIATTDLVVAVERCFAVINNLVGDLAKKTPIVTLRWDSAAGSEIHVVFGDIRNAPAAHDVIPAAELSGKVSISINPKFMARVLAGFDAETLRLSTSGRGTPLRIDAGPNRFAVLSPMRGFSHAFEEAA
jgi:DNA polymerase III sliding clamp (beta) subunit (PCNA family)